MARNMLHIYVVFQLVPCFASYLEGQTSYNADNVADNAMSRAWMYFKREMDVEFQLYPFLATLPPYNFRLFTSKVTHHFLVDISKLLYGCPLWGLCHYSPTESLRPGHTSLPHYIIFGPQEHIEELHKQVFMTQITMMVRSLTQNQTSWSVKPSGP